MTCKYCNGKLAPLRSLTDGEFCSDDHRQAFFAAHPQPEAFESLPEQELPTAFDAGGTPNTGRSPRKDPSSILLSPVAAQIPQADFGAPTSFLNPGSAIGQEDEPAKETEPPPAVKLPARGKRRLWGAPDWIDTAWRTAPSDLKVLALLLPLLLVLAAVLSIPSLHVHFSSAKNNALKARVRQKLSSEFQVLGERIASRAAIAITDDFRSGLDSWRSRSNLTHTWSFDSNGFVQPGPLAILKPTEDLRDYTFEFLGEIQQRAVGCAFRARDLDNYYAIKFIQDDSGAIPTLRLVRYAVIKGKEGPHVEKRLPSSIRADMLNRFRVEVHGSDFTILAQGEVVDFFSDQRLSSGGVGFFCTHGEKARLRWVEVSHQYDALGRLCAMLAPVGLAGVDKD